MQPLSEKTWEPRAIQDVFMISPGKRLEARNRKPGNRPFIGALDNSNGVVQFVSDANASLDRNVLGVNYNGNGMGIGFYHPYECVFSDDVKRFHLRDTADTKELCLFSKTLIEKQRGKFGYLYKFNANRMAATSIMLPVDDAGEPDYAYMASYANEIGRGLLMRYKSHLAKRISNLEHSEIPELNEKNWKKFKVFGDEGFLHIATTSSSIDGVRLKPGVDERVPYVTRTDTNNGIGRFVSDANFDFGFDEGGCITIGLDTQTAFWQPTRFVTGQNVQVITGDCLSFLFAQFLIPLLRLQMRAKFNWGGNGATLTRMKKLEMMLPVNDDGEIDILYMEQYAANMLLKKYEQYLAFLDRKASV